METYSLQRGELQHQQGKQVYDAVEREKIAMTAKGLNEDDMRYQLRLLDNKYYRDQFLMDEHGLLHPTAVKTHNFQAEDEGAKTFIAILSTPIKEVEHMRCPPYYRDGVIFYDNLGNRLAVVNICLSCWWVQLDANTYLDVDSSVYGPLTDYFIALGHDVAGDDKP